MIIDQLSNASIYSCISENFRKGFDYLRNTDLTALQPGKYEIDGKNVYVIVSEYESKDPVDCRLEAHRIYADIQYLILGNEAIGYANKADQLVTADYNSEKDIEFFSGETTPMSLSSGMFAVFFPQDLHQPCRRITNAEMVKKAVIKVAL
jgi:YhcH/YjgK/YiaL family protein